MVVKKYLSSALQLSFFVKSEKRMQEHILCCAGQAGFSFSFDNGKIIIGQF